MTKDRRQLIENVIDTAKALLAKDHYLAPVLFMYHPDGRVTMRPFPGRPGPIEKMAAQAFARAEGMDGALFITEGWAVESDKDGHLPNVPPSACDDRKSVVSVCYEEKDRTWVAVGDIGQDYSIDTDGMKSMLDEPVKVEGRLVGWI